MMGQTAVPCYVSQQQNCKNVKNPLNIEVGRNCKEGKIKKTQIQKQHTIKQIGNTNKQEEEEANKKQKEQKMQT